MHQIYVAAAGGGDPRPVPGTAGGFRPVFAPDGHTIAFQRVREHSRKNGRGGREVVYLSASIWLADLNGGTPRRLTPWRNGLDYALDWSARRNRAGGDPSHGAGSAPRTRRHRPDRRRSGNPGYEAADGIYSPDGSRIAYLLVFDRTIRHGSLAGTLEETTDLYTMSADGTDPRQITHSSASTEVWPSRTRQANGSPSRRLRPTTVKPACAASVTRSWR